MPSNEEAKLSFEAAFQKLEQTVQALEKGGLTLDQAIVRYEEGIRLAKTCTERLEGAQLKITELQTAFLQNGGERFLREEPSSEEENGR